MAPTSPSPSGSAEAGPALPGREQDDTPPGPSANPPVVIQAVDPVVAWTWRAPVEAPAADAAVLPRELAPKGRAESPPAWLPTTAVTATTSSATTPADLPRGPAPKDRAESPPAWSPPGAVGLEAQPRDAHAPAKDLPRGTHRLDPALAARIQGDVSRPGDRAQAAAGPGPEPRSLASVPAGTPHPSGAPGATAEAPPARERISSPEPPGSPPPALHLHAGDAEVARLTNEVTPEPLVRDRHDPAERGQATDVGMPSPALEGQQAAPASRTEATVAPAEAPRARLPEAEASRGFVATNRAEVHLGQGPDAVSVAVSTRGNHVRVEVQSASADLASAVREARPELGEALGRHGLALGDLQTSSHREGGGAPREQRQPQEPPQDSTAAAAEPDAPQTARLRAGVRAVL